MTVPLGQAELDFWIGSLINDGVQDDIIQLKSKLELKAETFWPRSEWIRLDLGSGLGLNGLGRIRFKFEPSRLDHVQA